LTTARRLKDSLAGWRIIGSTYDRALKIWIYPAKRTEALTTTYWHVDETIFPPDEDVLKQTRDTNPQPNKGGDHGIHPQPNLPRVSQEYRSRHGTLGRPAMTIDVVTAVLALLSVSVFVAHGLDAYRGAANSEPNLRAR
jgi:hypothetical protein